MDKKARDLGGRVLREEVALMKKRVGREAF